MLPTADDIDSVYWHQPQPALSAQEALLGMRVQSRLIQNINSWDPGIAVVAIGFIQLLLDRLGCPSLEPNAVVRFRVSYLPYLLPIMSTLFSKWMTLVALTA